ncbi:hypothetical protein bcere0005_6020 [Bacillus cereus 172560W]|nr:hypothetical protein bcere0005_6020 [Bacillus cereus 172560W]
MYMKKTAEIPQQSFFLFPPLLHPHYGINNRIMKNILIMTNVKKNLSL